MEGASGTRVGARLLPLALLVAPTVVGVYATLTDDIRLKMLEPLLCAAIVALGLAGRAWIRLEAWIVAAAFAFSAAGDYFLSNKGSNDSYFVIGIALYLLAHVSYTAYALRRGRIARLALLVLVTGYGAYFLRYLRPALHDAVLGVAVLVYLLISCVAVAAALGIGARDGGAVHKWLFVFGIANIVFSDTLISMNEFLHERRLNDLILPTYYLAHIAVSAALIVRQPPGPGATVTSVDTDAASAPLMTQQ